MALSQKETKRRSRASKGAKYHDMERKTSRKRMAIYRAKNKAQKQATRLKFLLCEEDRRELEKYVARQRQHLVADWFTYHGFRFDPKLLRDPKMLRPFMPKIEMHKVELQVAEFEISLIEDRDDGDDDDMDNGGIGFIPAARLKIDRRPGDDPAPKLRPWAKSWPKPAVALDVGQPVQSKNSTGMDSSSLLRAEMDPSSREATQGSGSKPKPALQAQTSAGADPSSRERAQALGLAAADEQEVLSDSDIDHLIVQALAPVVTDAEEDSTDGEAAAPPNVAAKAPPFHILAVVPAPPSFTKGRYTEEIIKSDEGTHQAVAEAMQLHAAAPTVAKAVVGRQAKEKEENKMFDESVDRAVVAAMAQVSRGGPLRRRTVAPLGPVESVEDLHLRPVGRTLGLYKLEEAPENQDLMEAMQSQENQDVLEAMHLFEGGFLGDATREQGGEGALNEAQVPQDELLCMDMECFDIGDNGLNLLESSAFGVEEIEAETFVAETFLW